MIAIPLLRYEGKTGIKER